MTPQAIEHVNGHAVAIFDPEQAKRRDSEADAVIRHAKRVKDWPLLERAVEQKIADQLVFLEWWRKAVGVRESPGRGGVKSNADLSSISVRDAEQQTGISQQQVSRWRKSLQSPEEYKAFLYGYAWAKAMATTREASQLVQQSLSNEHYTPEVYIEAARSVLGAFDLDPASCEEANATVKAERYYTEKNNGLELEWSGRIWLNPPYGGIAGEFIEKLAQEYEAGNVSEAIALVNAHCTDTSWFQPLWNGVLCFTNHRINFYGDDTRSGSTHGSVFVYFGQHRELFVKEFQRFGACVEKAAGVDSLP